MKRLLLLLICTLLPFAIAYGAEDLQRARPGGADLESVIVEAKVAAIDQASRQVTLKLGDQSYTVTAGPDVRNLDQVKVGDIVVATHTVAYAYQVVNGGEKTDAEATLAVNRANKGEKPGAAAALEISLVADITAVNVKDGVVTLKGPDGGIVNYHVRDKSKLQQVKPGNQVEIEIFEELAIAIEPKPVQP